MQVTTTPNTVPTTASTASNGLGDVATFVFGSSMVTVPLTETAQGAVLGFIPTSLPFGSVPIGGPISSFFAVQNTGNLPASVTLTLTGDPRCRFQCPRHADPGVHGGDDGRLGGDVHAGVDHDRQRIDRADEQGRPTCSAPPFRRR